ncbi:MAG: PhzF family phenazine biosynthesis isomerase [Spirochaetales bacterium]|nr:PhzF family phenazine biosynthesis isomerase [Spirochaetales bacterium]
MGHNKLWMVDSFTTVPFTGNPAGVLLLQRSLDEQQMIAIAREIGASESAFIAAEDLERFRVGIRFFTSTQEVGICTHATIAAFHVLVTEFDAPFGTYEMHSGGGSFSVTVGGQADHPTITLKQPDKGLQHILNTDELCALAEALGCEVEACQEAVVWKATTPRVLVKMSSKTVLNNLQVDRNLLIALGERLASPGFYCYTDDGAESPIAAHTRMFNPGSGIDEDPVTGNAAATLALYQRSVGLIVDGGRAIYAQGEAMGRPGVVAVTVKGPWAYIEGQATTVWAGSLID